MRIFLLLIIIFTASCAKNFTDDNNNPAVATQGLGDGLNFGSQQSGELFTTRAPHNQVYLFLYDNSVVADKYVASLQAQASYLVKHPKARVMLAGHTDERGSREYNVALGERRAQAVADILKLSGVSQRQLRVVSYGKERPISRAHDSQAYQLNRRVELVYEVAR